jgi:hypothetical protein
MQRSRDWRRHQQGRAKRRARKLIFSWSIGSTYWSRDFPRFVGIWANTRKACSSGCCCNPRPFEGDSHSDQRRMPA